MVGQDTEPRGLPWTAQSLPCGFRQQALDLPSIPHHQAVRTQGREQHSPRSTVTSQLPVGLQYLGGNFNCSGEERKKAEKKGLLGRGSVYVRKELFAGTANTGDSQPLC